MNDTSNVPQAINVFYDRRMLKRALPMLLHNKWAQVKDLPRNGGKTIKFRKYGALSLATTPLTEGVTKVGSQLAITGITATPLQYGDYVIYTDLLSMTTFDPYLMELAGVLGEQAGQTLDAITRDILHAGTSVQYADASSPKVNASRIEITSSDVLTESELIKALLTIKKQNAKKMTTMVSANTGYNTTPVQASYIVIVDPDTTALLWGAGVTGFKSIEMYEDKANTYEGEVGAWKEFRFVETTMGKVFTGEGAGGIDVHSTLVLSQDCYGVSRISGESMKNIIKQIGGGHVEDALDQRGSSGWKATHTAVILQQLLMLRIEHAV